MTLRKTCKWCLVLVGTAILTGIGCAWWYWSRSDELLRETILSKSAELAPDWKLELGRAHYDWDRRIQLHDVTIGTHSENGRLATLPFVELTIDRDRLRQDGEVIVHKIRLTEPTIELERNVDGTWNWQNLPALPQSDAACPEIQIERATIRISLAQPKGAESATIVLSQVDLKLVPSGKRQFQIQGLTHVEQAGPLSVEGDWDLAQRTWFLRGQINDVTIDGDLFSLIGGASAEFKQQLTAWDQTLRNARRSDAALESATQVALAQNDAVAKDGSPIVAQNDVVETETSTALPDFGVTGRLDLTFQVNKKSADAMSEYNLVARLRRGEVAHPILPFPLHHLEGTVRWNNQQVAFEKVKAKNGVTQLSLGGQLRRGDPDWIGEFSVKLDRLNLDERFRNGLPAQLQKLYDSLRPTGEVDVTAVIKNVGNQWGVEDGVMTVRDGSVLPVKFPYKLSDLQGDIRQTSPEKLEITVDGIADRRPISIRGFVTNPGSEAESELVLKVEKLPLNNTVRAALAPGLQKTWDLLEVSGRADGVLTLYRPPGEAQRQQITLQADFYDGSIRYKHFPYRLTALTGKFGFTSIDGHWSFTDLRARHGEVRLTGEGTFTKPKDKPGRLRLIVKADNARLDDSLRLALSEDLQQLWSKLAPSGSLDFVTDINWLHGTPPKVELPAIRVTRGQMKLAAFPYPLEDVALRASWTPGLCTIHEFSGRHDQTVVQADGWVRVEKNGDWRMRLVHFTADDIIADRDLRDALPKRLVSVFDRLNPSGAVSISRGVVEFRGAAPPVETITAAWDLDTVHSGGGISVGPRLENLFGSVNLRGTWDGRRVVMTGQVDLDSFAVLGYQVTRIKGPFRLEDTLVVVGSREALEQPEGMRIPRATDRDDLITARFVDGEATLAAVAQFGTPTPLYAARITLSQGNLERYAQRYMRNTSNLRGIMNGWVDLTGSGMSLDGLTGRGKMTISPAALYHLPILVQMFKALTFSPPDKTAFTYALFDFTIRNQHFRFQTIDLVGDAISLRGHGTAAFDGQLNLDFYSFLPRSNLSIPVVSFFLDEATKGWVGVTVRGNTSQPIAQIKPVPTIDETLRRFLGAFNPNTPNDAPRLTLPPFIFPQWQENSPNFGPR